MIHKHKCPIDGCDHHTSSINEDNMRFMMIAHIKYAHQISDITTYIDSMFSQEAAIKLKKVIGVKN